MSWALEDFALEHSLGAAIKNQAESHLSTLASVPQSPTRTTSRSRSTVFSEDQAEGLRRIFSPRPLRVVAFAQCGPTIGQTTAIIRIATQMVACGDAVLLADERCDSGCLRNRLGVNPPPGRHAFSQGLYTYGCRPDGKIPSTSELPMAADIMLVDAAPGANSMIRHASIVVLTARIKDSSDLKLAYAMLKAASKTNVPIGLLLVRQPNSILLKSRQALERIATEELGVRLSWMGSFDEKISMGGSAHPNSSTSVSAADGCRERIIDLLDHSSGRPS